MKTTYYQIERLSLADGKTWLNHGFTVTRKSEAAHRLSEYREGYPSHYKFRLVRVTTTREVIK